MTETSETEKDNLQKTLGHISNFNLVKSIEPAKRFTEPLPKTPRLPPKIKSKKPEHFLVLF